MHDSAPRPPGDGAVMWCASAVEAPPRISARIVAPRASATSHASRISTPAPSAITKPSRVAANGSLTFRDDIAVMLVKPARLVGVMAASLPPAATTSQRPLAIHMAASTSAWVPAAHAVLTVWHGPCQPHRIDTVALAAFGIIIGTRNGDTRRAPFSRVDEDLLLDRGDAADAGGDEHAAPQRVALDLARPGRAPRWRRPGPAA